MIKLGEKNFLLTDSNGDAIPFSAADLQSELINCFLSAGMRDSSCFAEDIALAVEFAMNERSGTDGLVGTQELHNMVVDILEKAGFHAVSEWFCRRNGRKKEPLFATDFNSIAEIAFKRGMVCDGTAVHNAVRRCEAAFRAAGIKNCSAALIVEMLRFFRNEEPSGKKCVETGRRRIKGDYIVRTSEAFEQFPDVLKELADANVLKIHNITVYHPSIRIHADFNAYAALRDLQGTMTEMFWEPFALELGQSIDAAVEVMQRLYCQKEGEKELPVYFTVNGMDKFLAAYFGADAALDRKLPLYLMESLQNNMVNNFYKVRF